MKINTEEVIMNEKIVDMKYEVLKNTITLWKNNENIGINELIDKMLELNNWKKNHPNRIDGIKSVNRFIISELIKQLDHRGLVMVEVELIGNHNDWRCQYLYKNIEDHFRRFICFIPKVVCDSKDNITFFLSTLFRELSNKLEEDYNGYEYVQYLDLWKDVKFDLKNPLKNEVLEPIFGTNKFIWIYPNQMNKMKDFSSTRYYDLYNSWKSNDEEYMKGISKREKKLCDDYSNWRELIRDYDSNKTNYSQRNMNQWLEEEMNIKVKGSEDK